MASCLDNIVVLGICPDEGPSLSGFTLLNAAGISLKNLAAITTDNSVSGVDMALQVKARSILQVRNDFISVLQSNNVIPTISAPVYETSLFDPGLPVGTSADPRGVTLYKNLSYRGTLRRTRIEAVELFPLETGTTTLTLFDGISTYTYPISVVANQLNVFNSETLAGFPFLLTGDSIRVTVDQSVISFASAKIACAKGCGGTVPNPCGWAEGWQGISPIKSEGFGVNLKFKCECDYEQILCDLAKSFIGELIWLKWQYNIFDEQLKSNRFTNWVIYNQEKLAKEILPDLESQYTAKWNGMISGILSTLKIYRDDCLDCRATRWKTNI